MKLIDNPRRVLRHFSTIALSLSTAITGAYLLVPEDLRAQLPAKWIAGVVFALSVWGGIGKVIKQRERP